MKKLISLVIGLAATVVAVAQTPSLEIKVDGDGYLRFAHESNVYYAKQVKLTVSNGKLSSPNGAVILPAIKIPADTRTLTSNLQGRIFADGTEVGRLVIALFPDDIRPIESNGLLKLYGEPTLEEPGNGLAGIIRPLETTDSQGEIQIKVYEPTTAQKTETFTTETQKTEEPRRLMASGHKPDAQYLKTGGVEVVLPAEVHVDGETFILGEVAEIFASAELASKLSGLTIGTTPPLGVDRIIDRTLIIAKLKQAGVDATRVRVIGPVQCKVKRVGQTVDHAMFLQAAEKAAQDKYGQFEAESRQAIQPLTTPIGNLDLRVEAMSRSGDTLSVTVAAYVDEKRINSRTVRLINRAVPITLNLGDTVTVVVHSNDVHVEATGVVKRVDKVTGTVTVELATGKQMTGKLNQLGQIEVKL
ncbi:hypothetical protein QPK87_31710 [Kamptonema cortianum]|nr:hypothetical protein [Geitlerinema splendidum]MDK3161092.1 hypothetical protein [Kamptonema cortianum]